ncbi:MAG: nitrophenyl compound nitroreductase subunit ArsF family protein [Bacteroidales bacterium]
MKKLIITLTLSLLVGVISVSAQCCDSNTAAKSNTTKVDSDNQNNNAVKAYYFHRTYRCATCTAVENVSKSYIKDTYGNKVPFQSINIENDASKSLVKKYKITGQALLIVKGEKVVNLTNDAFLNVRTKPEKLKAKIKTTIDSLK